MVFPLSSKSCSFNYTSRLHSALQHKSISPSLLNSLVIKGTWELNGCKMEFLPECEINAKDKNGLTPLDIAKIKGNRVAEEILLKNGALSAQQSG